MSKELFSIFISFMEKYKLDFFITNTSDSFLNEYIPDFKNSVFLMTGFSGSTGEILVTHKEIFLFVDGRYHIQAEKETDSTFVNVEKIGMDRTIRTALLDKVMDIGLNNSRIGIVSSKISCFGYKNILEKLDAINPYFIEYESDPVLLMIDESCLNKKAELRYISENITGATPFQRLSLVKEKMQKLDIDTLLVSKLDDIAYITNLRGNEIPYNSAFEAKCIINNEKGYLFFDLSTLNDDLKLSLDKDFEFYSLDFYSEKISKLIQEKNKVGFSPSSTTLLDYRILEKTGCKFIELEISPVSEMKSVKNSFEIEHLKECFAKTDNVVNKAISLLNQSLNEGKIITEKDFSDLVKELFMKEGALGLSFEVISSSGSNTAIIHYTNPDSIKPILKGELVLLDCGAYFEGGYATDITRTFIAGGKKAKPSKETKKIYTTVLKAFLNGLNYPVNINSSGFDIDKKVRDIINLQNNEGFKFSHGTGHGVGICVHEDPPRVSPAESAKKSIKTGMCFTIEPGLYKFDWGGVRLENTVMLMENNGKLYIESLSRAKFDENLVDYNILTDEEIKWFEEYQKRAIG